MKKKISKKVLWALVPVLAAGVLVGGRAVVSAAERQEAENMAKTCVPADAVLQGKETEEGTYKFYYYAESTNTSYEVEISRSSGEIRELETDLRDGVGAQEATLSEEEIQTRVQELYPGAQISGMQLGQDDGLYSYEVYFRADDKYGSLELNAGDGTLLESKIKYGTPVVIPAGTGTVTSDTSYLSKEDIQNLVSEAYPDCQLVAVEMDWENGRYVYEVEFFAGDRKYDLDYDALTGEVLAEESKPTNWRPAETSASQAETGGETSSSQQTAAASETAGTQSGNGETAAQSTETTAAGSSNQQQISEEQAREIALARAEAANPEILQLHLERDDGRLLYEGKMQDDASQYEFEIDAYTGVVLKWETEVRYTGQNASGGGSAAVISMEDASSIVLGKAQGGDAWIVEIQLDEDDGRLIYEGEMRDSTYEYEFEIDAYTGTVIQWEVE